MSPEQLFRDGKLDEAIAALSTALRDRPGDHHSRTFLFELLCFAGDYTRAEKQLETLEQQSSDAATGGPIYHGTLRAERKRQDMFATKAFPGQPESVANVSGTFNGRPFESIEDADPRIGPFLEVIAGGEYRWLPWKDVASLEMEPPKKLRNLLWAPVALQAAESSAEREFGQVLLPVISPLSWQQADGAIRLGRVTEWTDNGTGEEVPLGLKMLLVDGEEIPFLEIRTIEIFQPETM